MVVESRTPTLDTVSLVQYLRATTYNWMILPSLHPCKLFDRRCYTAIAFVLAMIKFTHVDVIRMDTRMVTTARYPS